MSTTPRALIAGAFGILNVFQPGASIPDAQEQFAFTFLNWMLGQWALQSGTIPAITREQFTLTAGKGGPSNPYTIGPGGDFNTTKPPSQASLTGASLVLGGTSPAVIIPRALLTDDQWEGLRIPELTNALFTEVYYNPTYASGLGTINLWPVPNTTANSLILWRKQQIAQFTGVTQSVTLPDGYEEPIVGALAQRLAEPFGRTMPPQWDDLANRALGIVKRSNLKLADLPQDPAFTHNRSGGYNINTGQP